MGLFKRGRPTPTTHPVTDFWVWWAESGMNIDPRSASRLSDELTRRVERISSDLTWHFGPGSRAEHRLTLSAGGDPMARIAAERWRRAGTEDATWEFASSQQADPAALDHVLEIGGHRIDLSELRFGVETDLDGRRAHVQVFHPQFGAAGEDVSGQVTFLALDWLLGEDVVERWIGAVEPSATAGAATGTAAVVQRAVDALLADHEDDVWIVAEWTTETGAPGLASFRSDLRWIDHPTFDLHHRSVVRYAGQENGLPDSESLDRLHELEDAIHAAVGTGGVLVAHETAEGRRTFHVYTDGEDQNVADALASAVDGPHVSTTSEHDPAWRAAREFTG